MATYHKQGRLNLEEPPESFYDGCIGGWYRTEFCYSLLPYLRPVRDGVYSPNLRLDQCRDTLVIEAVQYYEQHQTLHRSWFEEGADSKKPSPAKK